MAFVPVPDAAMARIEFIEAGQLFSINPWFTKSNFSNADMATLGNTIDGVVHTDWKPTLNAGVAYSGVRVYDMRTDGGGVVFVSVSAGNGSSSGDALPINTCAVLTLYTAMRGRSGRGRLYMGGLSESSTNEGAFLSAVETAVEAFYSALSTAVQVEGWVPVVVSKYHNGVLRPEGAITNPVTSWSMRNLNFGTQRRRVDRS